MKTKLAVLLTIVLIGCRPEPRQPEAQKPTQKSPSLTEVFNLRSRCAELAHKIDEGLAYGSAVSREVASNYSVQSNRCYVTLSDVTTRPNGSLSGTSTNLYDGQTQELLAFAQQQEMDTPTQRMSGMIFGEDEDKYNNTLLSMCHPGGDCGFAFVNDYIAKIMKRDAQ
jgi:hypothetical protein